MKMAMRVVYDEAEKNWVLMAEHGTMQGMMPSGLRCNCNVLFSVDLPSVLQLDGQFWHKVAAGVKDVNVSCASSTAY
jgi:hypothetical protein